MRSGIFFHTLIFLCLLWTACPSRPPFQAWVAGVAPIPAEHIHRLENQAEAYIMWKQAGVRDRVVVHIAPFLNMQWLKARDVKRGQEAQTTEALQALLYDPLEGVISPQKVLAASNYLYLAGQSGMIREVYWVVPEETRVVLKDWYLPKLTRGLRDVVGRITSADLESFKITETGIVAQLYGIKLHVCGISDLPRFEEPVLLDIDASYLCYKSAFKQRRLALPRLWPEELVAALGQRHVQTDLVTIAYSVASGFLPLEFRYLADELAWRLEHPQKQDAAYERLVASRRKGDQHRLAQEYGRAIKAYQQALGVDPKDPASYYGLSLVYEQLGQPQDAQEAYKRAVQLAPYYEHAEWYQAQSYLTQWKYIEATPLHERLLEQCPENIALLFNLGICYKYAERFNEAIDLYQKAITLNPEYGTLYNNLGGCYAHTGRLDDAIANYKKALKLGPSDRAAYNLGGLYMHQGKWSEATAYYTRAIRNNPTLMPAHLQLGECYFQQSRYKEAKKHWERAREIDTTHPAVKEKLELLEMMGY